MKFRKSEPTIQTPVKKSRHLLRWFLIILLASPFVFFAVYGLIAFFDQWELANPVIIRIFVLKK